MSEEYPDAAKILASVKGGISQGREWVIQRFVRWSGRPGEGEVYETVEEHGILTRDEVLRVLAELQESHPDSEFRGHRLMPKKKP